MFTRYCKQTSMLRYIAINIQEEKESLGEDLINGTNRGISAHKVNDDDFYKVPWLEAMDLVRARRVLVRGGYAFIPREELISLVVGVFRQQLSHNLGKIFQFKGQKSIFFFCY